MAKIFLAAGVAALALAAPVSAKPEKGGGGEHKAHVAKADKGGGQAKAFKAKGADRQVKAREFKAAKGPEFKSVNKSKGDDRVAKFDRKDRDFKAANKADRRDVVRVRDFDDDWDRGHWAVSCPPGLSKHPGVCMPHGQAKRLVGGVLPAAFRNSMLPLGLRNIYRDDDDYMYRLGDGYLYKVNRDTSLVASLLPLFGAGLMPGQMFPSAYGNPYMPQSFQAFYPDNRDDYYRFANGYVYEVDRDTGMIESMVPLMANGYGMGQMLPLSYSAYNVPYQYRGLYADNNDYMYRYAPGAIYQVDPTTRLITAVASLLTGNGLSVGQALPMGYSTYNVPLAYRDQYYDTADSWYRYNNGYIYQVDPKTQLVTALIRAIV
ncbi:MAG TPA: hypothetical protein VE403_01700 [Sphingomicrobium sp.]|nr:hypothetical protein [Sphingomicrobium sp.]